jgi:hypothetical protein
MTADNRPIPKSLHTVTVLVKLARHFEDWESMPPEDAVDFAMRSLGLRHLPDPHGLRAAALKQLNGKPS